jgi:hemolysin III
MDTAPTSRSGGGGLATVVDAVAEELPRPRLRGWIHLTAAPVAVVVAVLLWQAAAPGISRASVTVFGIALVGLYTTSGLYHLPRWPARVRHWLSRADVAMIQLFIAASFTPIAVHALGGAWRVWSLAVAWGIGLIGAVIAASPLKGPRWLSVVGYTAFGSLAVVPLFRIVRVLPTPGLMLLGASCALYVIGGVVYARRRPNPWPSWFGFHEVFHVLVVAAGATHVIALWEYTLPLG